MHERTNKMKFFAARSQQTELMDEQNTPFAEYHHCLQSLETINVLTLAYYPTLHWLKLFLKKGDEPLHIVDIASGGGDMLRRIEKLARRYDRPVKLTGIDLDPMAKRSALAVANENSAIAYLSADIFEYQPAEDINIAICSLFTHHLDDDQLVRLILWLDENTKQGWFINDLHRHWLPYYFIKAATAVFSQNRLIRHDAPLSVARSFKKRDWQALLQKADIPNHVRIKWFFPFRWGLTNPPLSRFHIPN